MSSNGYLAPFQLTYLEYAIVFQQKVALSETFTNTKVKVINRSFQEDREGCVGNCFLGNSKPNHQTWRKDRVDIGYLKRETRQTIITDGDLILQQVRLLCAYLNNIVK